MKQSLATSFSQSVGSEMANIAGTFVEIGIDTILGAGLLKDLPFIDMAVSIYKIGQSIRDRENLRKIAAFIEQINLSMQDESEIKEYKERFEKEEKFRSQELSHVLILIDRYIGIARPKILAKLYLAYLRGNLNWSEFASYAEIVDRLLPEDYKLLFDDGVKSVDYQVIDSGYLRLAAHGLMVDYGKNTGITMGSISVIGGSKKIMRSQNLAESLCKPFPKLDILCTPAYKSLRGSWFVHLQANSIFNCK